MADGAVGAEAHYWAFISYSHKDAVFGRRLHKRLEDYVLPRRLIGRATENGLVPRRLVPIFRDREELPAATDLSAEVRAALTASRSLVVVCSPAAAESKWVSREVELFRALHPGRPILAAIRDGEPGTCFPEVLFRIGPAGEAVEPLAADFRPGRDGERLGLLKLVAGIVGVGLDELVQRDAQRNLQRVTAVTAGALLAMIAMGLLTAYALNARTEAERQRSQAEGMVEFMLTDLRSKLKGVGRLDIMSAVNERALHYYADQNLNTLSVDSLERRARILHAMGEDDEARGDYDAALAKFDEARRTTATLLAEAPNDAERIFNHAQSVFWVGSVDYARKDRRNAKTAFMEYKRLADRLTSLAPDSRRYCREPAYAESNLCTLALDTPVDPKAAIKWCGLALGGMERAKNLLGTDSGIVDDLIDQHAWMADAYVAAGNSREARAERIIEDHLLEKEMAADPQNMKHKSDWVALQIALALLDEKAHQLNDAKNRLYRVEAIIDSMIDFDPSNQSWQFQRSWVRSKLRELR